MSKANVSCDCKIPVEELTEQFNKYHDLLLKLRPGTVLKTYWDDDYISSEEYVIVAEIEPGLTVSRCTEVHVLDPIDRVLVLDSKGTLKRLSNYKWEIVETNGVNPTL